MGLRLFSLAVTVLALSSSHVSPYHDSVAQVREPFTSGWWGSRERGQKCRERCFRSTAQASGFCSAMASFVSTSACVIFSVEDPLICGLVEGPLSGLSSFCGAGFLEAICDSCEKSFNIRDVFYASDLNQRRSAELAQSLQNVTELLKETTKIYHKSMVDLGSQMESSLMRIDLLVRFKKILNRLRFLSYLFNRVIDTDSFPSVKKYYIDAAADKSHQDGLVNLLRTLHVLLIGQETTIWGKANPSVFNLDKSLCHPSSLSHLDQVMLSIYTQINFLCSSTSDSDCSLEDFVQLQSWMKSLRMEQLNKIQRECSNRL